MKNTFIFVDAEGSPVYSAVNFTDDGFYTHGSDVGGNTCIEYDGPINHEEIVKSYYYTGYEFLQKPECPGPHHSWTKATGWADLRNIEYVKAERRDYINKARSIANQASFTYDGKEIAADRLSRSDIDGVHGYITMVGSFPTGWPGGWKAMDNTYVQISTTAEWVSLYTAMVNQGTINFGKAQSLKQQIDAATTIAEVEAVVW